MKKQIIKKDAKTSQRSLTSFLSRNGGIGIFLNSYVVKIIILSTGLLTLDLLTKYFFYNKNILSNLSFTNPTFNLGISRGIQANIVVIIIVSIIALFIFTYLLKIKHISRIIFSVLIAGTLGNLIDRIFLGGVRDFISISNFPVFNLADVLLNIGIILILIKEFFFEKYEISKPTGNFSKKK